MNSTARYLLCGMALFLSFAVMECRSASVETGPGRPAVERPGANALVARIDEINRNAPRSIRGQFVVQGSMSNRNKFKSLGNVVFNRDPYRMKITFIDAVFRTTLTEFTQIGNEIKILLPIEKKLYIDKADMISLRDYTGMDVDFQFISALATGLIPLIENFTIKQSNAAQQGADKNASLAILENDEWFETVSLRNNTPDKILLINKKTLEKMEFYLETPHNKDGMVLYKQIRFISLKKGDRITLELNNLRQNTATDLESEYRLQNPGKAKVITVH